MRRYLAISVGLAFLLFMAAAMAQNSGQAGSSSSQAGQSYPSGSQAGQSSPSNPSGQASEPSAQESSKAAGKTRTVEGCIAQEQSDYFLIPKSGNPILLQASGAENPSAHVGHRVKVKGNEQSISAGGGAGMAGGAAGAASSSATGQQSGAESNPGAVGSQTGPGAQSGAAAGGELRQNAEKEISVDKITMVSESCPANWNPKYKSEEQSKPSSSSQTPPPQF